jgi:hypothetical protein
LDTISNFLYDYLIFFPSSPSYFLYHIFCFSLRLPTLPWSTRKTAFQKAHISGKAFFSFFRVINDPPLGRAFWRVFIELLLGFAFFLLFFPLSCLWPYAQVPRVSLRAYVAFPAVLFLSSDSFRPYSLPPHPDCHPGTTCFHLHSLVTSCDLLPHLQIPNNFL